MSELTPYLCVGDARAAIDWYRAVLGAAVTFDPIVMDDGRIGHVQLAVDGAEWMMSDAFEGAGVAAPDPDRGAPVSLHLAVADVDALCDRVTAAGIGLDRGPEDTEHGRTAVFGDPFGHRWFVNSPAAD